VLVVQELDAEWQRRNDWNDIELKIEEKDKETIRDRRKDNRNRLNWLTQQ